MRLGYEKEKTKIAIRDAYSGYAGYEGEKAGYAYVPGLGYIPQIGHADPSTSGVGGSPEGKENGNKIGYMN